MNFYEKGLFYERYVKDFIINKLNKQVYLWNECPENILIDNHLVSSHNHLRKIRKEIIKIHINAWSQFNKPGYR